MPQRTILAIGHFDLEGGRSWVIRTGLEEAGWKVELCRTEKPGLLAKYADLWTQWKRRWSQQKIDALYVPFSGHYLLPLAWWIARSQKIPLVFDAFLSLYDTEVEDRCRLSRFDPRAWALWCTDWLCCRLCDVVLLDTEEHRAYFVRRYGSAADKIFVLPIGCRTDLFHPMKVPEKVSPAFRVTFHGTFIPLQGIDVILGAARILQEEHQDIFFEIIGRGQTYDSMRALTAEYALTNVAFIGAIPMAELPGRIAQADICLGIFGTTQKALRVIPNKAYEVLACGKPLLTADTPAIRRLLTDRQTAVFSAPGDAADLAAKILLLKHNPVLREKIAAQGHALFLEKCSPHAIVAPLCAWLRQTRQSDDPGISAAT